MSENNKLTALNIIAYLISLLIVLTITFKQPPIQGDHRFRRILIGAVFNAICITGVFAVVLPKTCSGTLSRKTRNPASEKRIKGHHPNCKSFSSHVVEVRGHTLCAACIGLFLGGVSAMIFSTIYFFSGVRLENSLQLVSAGVLMVTLILLGQAAKGFTRVFLNVLFPIGGMLVLIGIDNLFESLFLDIFIMALIVFWILVRTMVSSWTHWKICSRCRSHCTAEN